MTTIHKAKDMDFLYSKLSGEVLPVEEEEEKTASDIESSPAKPEPFIIPDKPEKPVDAAQTILTPESEPENSEKSPAP